MTNVTNNNNNNPRKIYLFSLIDNSSAERVTKRIIEINEYDDEQEKKVIDYKREPIELIINSEGGNAFHGWAIVSAILLSRTPVHGICLGQAMSMGFIIFAVCHKRFAHKYSTFMYHEIAWGAYDKAGVLEGILNEAYRLMEMYDEVIIEKTKITNSTLKKVRKEKEDWFFSAEEAHKLGLVDVLL